MRRAGTVAWKVARLMAAGLVLSWCVSVRFPAETPVRSWLLPSGDVALMLALFALFGASPPSAAARAWVQLCCGALMCVRLGRVAEGICQRYLDRSFHLAADLPLVPEFVRLAHSTLGPWKLSCVLVAALAACALIWYALHVSLSQLVRELSSPRRGDLYLVLAGGLALSALNPQGTFYSSSVAPRLEDELEQWLTAHGWLDDPAHAAQRASFERRFTAGQERLREAARQLPPGRAIDVHVVLVEAYGRTVQSTAIFAQHLLPSYQAFEQRVAAAGFHVCTDFVRAPMLGGNSWLTHATLETGAAVQDQFDYRVLLEHNEVSSLAKSFGAAGYRTVSVKPGTTRPEPRLRMYGFDQEYNAPDFDYRGRAYAWAPMPDQFVMQRVAERELLTRAKPLFIEYALVSSHFPFNPRPPYVDDWHSLGDGSVFKRLPPLNYDVGQSGMLGYALGYLDSLSYDLRVLSTYLAEHVQGDALVLILGDHQPVAPLAGEDRSRFTPLHVLSKRDALLEPFRARGCTSGMIGKSAEPQWTMEDLGADLLGVLASRAGAP